MAEKLTQEQWRDMKPPFSWMTVRADWTKTQFEMVEKLLYSRTSGWWYSCQESDKKWMYVFECAADMVDFRLILADDPFKEDFGEITS